MKDLKISKELLSEILNYEVDAFLGITKNEIDYTCCRDENEGYIDISINLYEFAFKCKEWAYENGYDIWSITWGAVEFQNNEKYNGTERITEDTEVGAIIQACNWILEKEIQEENRLQLQEDLTEYNKLIKEGL